MVTSNSDARFVKQFVKFTNLSNTSSEEGIMPNINKAAKKYLPIYQTEALTFTLIKT